jgi:regulator of protease activity HflC (stomatin/prohibitin superfamily)
MSAHPLSDLRRSLSLLCRSLRRWLGRRPVRQAAAPARTLADPPPLPSGMSRRALRAWLAGLGTLLILFYLWRSIFIPIGSGQLGIRWSRFDGGTDMGHVYGEGYPAIWPWDTMTVYDTRLQEMHNTVAVLTADGLEVSLDVTARFAPRAADLPMLHRSVGPRYRETVVWPDVVAALRQVIRQFKPDELRVLGEAGLSTKVDDAARSAVQSHWVDLDRVLITRIALPERLSAEIQEKLAQEQKALAYEFILKQAEMERQKWSIEADGIREFEERSRISMLKWRGIQATERLAASPNTKIIVMGAGENQLPVLLNGEK